MFSKRVVPTSILTLAILLLFSSVAGAVGSISGQVNLEHEFALIPVAGASVTALSQDSHFVAMARTDSSGSYQINNLQAGNYRVVACKLDLGCLFYPGTSHPDSARMVAVVDNQVTSGIDFTFRPFLPEPPPSGLITGLITNAATGDHLSSARVFAKPLNNLPVIRSEERRVGKECRL